LIPFAARRRLTARRLRKIRRKRKDRLFSRDFSIFRVNGKPLNKDYRAGAATRAVIFAESGELL
jgi:hypothetical protein